ncbi:sensor histidine kinase [Aquisalibacillus elongatus]|uniref:histidine kinase n=1 Tax=Aquisalibacillus elongatus TaxID=485577 RepID=A0A3N5B9W5_9BACI|nr:ATP-binding protein [Aquisalibacillus elongatus]RPF52260.1 signal transduction histidine kinase [Aquisalibacillus elongatus]
MKLKNKIFLYSTFLFVIVIVALSVTVYFTFTNITYDREMERIESEAGNVLSGLRQSNEQFSYQDILRVYDPSNGMLRIVNRDGQVISATVSGDESTSLREVDANFERGRQSQMITYDGQRYGLVQLPTIWEDGQVVYLQFFSSLDAVESNLDTLRIVLMLVTFIAIIPILVSGRLLSDLIIRPIQSLIQTMNDIKSSQSFKHIPIEKTTNDELSTMSETFNDLMDLLKENYEKQEAFVSNASHELRTPLTVIGSYASLVKRRGLERPEVVKESIEAIHTEALRMKGLTEQLLLLARRDKDWKLNIETVTLSDVVTNVATNMKRAYNRDIRLNISESAQVSTDEEKLKQLLYIFIDNAIKYSDEAIDVELLQKSQPVIKIKDQGIGIPSSAQAKIFDRFYRVDQARTRDEGGTGLGLAVAKEIADTLNIKIDLESEKNQGTTVILTVHSFHSH